MERYHCSTKEALADDDLGTLSRARERMGVWLLEYNEHRLHAGLRDLTPADFYRGDSAVRRTDPAEKVDRFHEVAR